MRRLLLVPIVHDEADLGRSGAVLAQESARLAGEGRWAVHRGSLCRFWEQVAAYLGTFEPRRLKVYQDGLPSDGSVGRRIVEEAAERGSENYRLVLELLNRGAELRRTEDPQLLLQEHQHLLGLLGQAAGGQGWDAQQYRSQRNRLLKARDGFIARTIDATLKEGEVGVLFMGAEHRVASGLPADIAVEVVKDPKKVRAYVAALFGGGDERAFARLARYLGSPIRAPSEKGRDSP